MQCTQNLIVYVGVSRSYPLFLMGFLLLLILLKIHSISLATISTVMMREQMRSLRIFKDLSHLEERKLIGDEILIIILCQYLWFVLPIITHYSSSLTSSVSSLVSDEEEEDHHTKSLEVPESSSLEEYIQVQAGDDFSPPLIGN